MGSCAAPSAKGDDKFITTDYLQQCPKKWVEDGVMQPVLKDKMHYSTPICLITHKGKNHNNILKTFMEMLEKRIANN
ncbi:hypothetical protein FPK80_14675 [Acinetobacter baumannii]|nr:hypothetical protein [Acinetobacter baumannii]